MSDAAADHARFNPLIRPYLVLYVAMFMVLTVVGIPLLVPWLLGVGQWWARHYFARLECVLGENSLRFRKGIILQVEKTIPLENIQDVTFIEGPLLRRFQLSVLRFETAGHGSRQANDMSLVGIIDAHEFRTRILQRREVLRQKSSAARAPAGDSSERQIVLLERIAQRLDELALALRPKD